MRAENGRENFPNIILCRNLEYGLELPARSLDGGSKE